jgi:hypothetical protein
MTLFQIAFHYLARGKEFQIHVVDCIYKARFGTWATNAIITYPDLTYSIIFFFSDQKYEVGKIYNITGIAEKSIGKITQLKRVYHYRYNDVIS